MALCLYSLARVTQKHPEYSGPSLGPKMATKNERNFTEEQNRRGRDGTLFLQSGSNKGASQAGHGGMGNTRHMWCHPAYSIEIQCGYKVDILYKLTTDRMTSYIVSAQIFLIYIAGEEVRREKLCISLQMTSVWNVTSVHYLQIMCYP